MNFTWTAGRMLESAYYYEDDEKVELLRYTYSEDGIRTSKTCGGVTTYYTTIDGTITSQYQRDSAGKVINQMLFLYDSTGSLLGFTYDGETYFYITNHMGDVIGITDADGNYLVSYYYDAWGNLETTRINNELNDNGSLYRLADLNPMRYRGYYYEDEIGTYYLQSRYYIPAMYRFMNADLPEYAKFQKNDSAGINLFSYCNNDPVNNSDPKGTINVRSFFKSLVGKIKNVANELWKGIKRYIKEVKNQVIPIRKRSNKILISATALSVVIDMLVYYMNPGLKPISMGLKGTLKFMPKPTAVQIFKYSVVDKMNASIFTPLFKLCEKVIKTVLGFSIDTISGSLKGAIWAISNLSISNVFSLAVSCTSIGGIISSFLDLMDNCYDGFVTIPRRG